MSKTFSQSEFKRALSAKCPNPQPCPFCGKKEFIIADMVSQMPVQSNMDGIEIGRSIPCGILLCKNCGHVDFFSLGIMGLITRDGDSVNGEKK